MHRLGYLLILSFGTNRPEKTADPDQMNMMTELSFSSVFFGNKKSSCQQIIICLF